MKKEREEKQREARLAAEERQRKQREKAEQQKREAEARKKAAAGKKKNNIQSGTKVDKYDFQGQMQQAEIIENNKGFRDAEIYEGGDADVELEQNTQNDAGNQLDPNKEYLDYDRAMEDENLIHKIPYTRLMRVKDWKHKYPSAFEAFKNQALRPNTQQFFNAMIVFVAGFIILVAASMGVLGAGIGFISCQPCGALP
mgnify:CR=1 FL=1